MGPDQTSRCKRTEELLYNRTAVNCIMCIPWNDQFLSINLNKTATDLKVPVYFIQGKHDFITCSTITEEYFNNLNTTYKELVIFENSAHCPIFEEPKKFNALLIEKVRKHAEPSSEKEPIFSSSK